MRRYGRIGSPKRFQKWYLNDSDIRVKILRTTRTYVYYHMSTLFDVEHMPIKEFIKIYSRRL